MKIKLHALNKLAYVESLTEKNSPFIANQYVRWTYDKDTNKLNWTINTSTYQICLNINSSDITEPHEESFDVGLNTIKFFAVLKTLRDDDVLVTLEDGNIRFINGSLNVLIPTIVGQELTDPIEINNSLWAAQPYIKASAFKDIDKLSNFTTSDNTVFSGVTLRLHGDKLEMYASNRNAVYYVSNTVEGSHNGEPFVLPKVFTTLIGKLGLSDDAKVKLGKLSDNNLFVIYWSDGDNKGFVSCRKLDFQASNVTRALDITHAYTFKVNKNELLDSVKLYEIMSELNNISFEADRNSLLIEHPTLSKRIMLTTSDGLDNLESFKFTLGVKDLIAILNTLSGNVVSFGTNKDEISKVLTFKEDNKTIVQSKMRRF